MSILLQKLYSKYHRYTDVGNVIGFGTLDRLKSGKLPKFETFYKKLDLEREIGYTYEDFLIDYLDIMRSFKEKKAVYNIWRMGLSIYEYAIMKGKSSSQLYRILRRGRQISFNETLKIMIDIFEVDITTEELQKFNVTIKPMFCKLLGQKEDLILFKENYNIKNPVLPWQDTWQLAFDGIVAEKIKRISK